MPSVSSPCISCVQVGQKAPATLAARAALAGHTCHLDEVVRVILARWGRSVDFDDITADSGLSPMGLRAWGTVFSETARDGYIRRSEGLFRRSLGNGSLTPGWVGA